MAGCGKFIDLDTFRVSPITPFTYRDGLTYLQVLEELRKRDCELVDLINAGLAKAAEDLNAAIAKLWDELEGPLAKIAEFESEMEARFAQFSVDLEHEFEVFQQRCLKIIEDAIEAASDPEVFSWHRGVRTKLSQELFDADNHYSDHGLTAGDYTRKGWTVQEIEDLGRTVEWVAYRGKTLGPRWSPRLMHSDRVGTQVSIRAQIAAAAETGLHGTTRIDVPCDTITFIAREAQERIVS